MRTHNHKKIITAIISASDISIPLKDAELLKTSQEKLKFAKSILDIPENFDDNIDMQIEDNNIKFQWVFLKINHDAERIHKNALALARKGELEKALEQWNNACLLNANDPDYFFNLGVANYELKRFQDSIEHLNHVLAICPLYYKAHIVLGTAYLKIRKFEFAKRHFQKSLLFNKNNALTFLNLGVINSILKLYDEGIEMFERAIALSPIETRAYLGLAKIYSTIGNIEKSNIQFKKVIELDPQSSLANYAKRSIVTIEEKSAIVNSNELKGNPEDYYSEGYRCFINCDYIKSALMYKKYLSIKPDDGYIWYSLGEAQLRMGKPDLALESFRKAIKLHPSKGLYFKELAIVFDKLQQPDKVIIATSKAIELGKQDSVLYCLWGKALLDLGKYQDSIIILEKSLTMNKNNLLAQYLLADALIKNKEIEEALDHLHVLNEIEIKSPLKLKVQKLFNELNNR